MIARHFRDIGNKEHEKPEAQQLRLFAVMLLTLLALSSALSEPIGEVDTVGITWHEEQFGCANPGPQIARDSVTGNIYIVWTYAPYDHYWVTGGSAFNFYNPDSGWAYGDSGLEMFPGVYNHEDHSVLLRGSSGGRDALEMIYGASGSFPTYRSWWNGNQFESSPLDTIRFPYENTPIGALTNDGAVHILARGEIWPSLYTLIYANYNLQPYTFTGWQAIDTLSGGYCIATSPVTEKVAVIYNKQRDFLHHSSSGPFDDKDIYLITSSDGLNWDFQDKTNVTDCAESDPFRPYYGSDLIIDYADNIHIAFNNLELKINRAEPDSYRAEFNMCFIWHWSEVTDSFTVVADGWLRDPADNAILGYCSRTVNRPQMAINPANSYLYMLYERYYPDERSYLGYGVADLWITVSTDNGLNWSTGVNITDTHTSRCHPGDCSSEIQASLLDVVNDTLHITYILDKDAGVAQEEEGSYTQNYVIYQKIPADLIPTTPLIEQFSFREGPVRCSYLLGDLNGDSLKNGADVVNAVNYLKGGGAPLSVDCDCQGIIRPFYAAGDVNGSCCFNGMDVTFYISYLKGRYGRLRFCYDCPPDRI